MAVSTTITNSANLHSYYEKKLLVTAEPRLVLYQMGKKQKLPKGNGKLVKWLRYSAISGSTSALTEGVPPSEIAFSTSNVTTTALQYGQFSKVSDLLSDTAIDPVLDNLATRFGVASAKTLEQLIVAELDATAAVQRVNSRANDAAIVAGDVLNHKEIIKAMITQKAAFIGPHEMGSYIVVLNPQSEHDLMVDSQAGAWLDIHKYNDEKPLMNGELGKMYGARFFSSDLMTREDDAGSGGTVDIFNSYVIGEEAFGCVELNGDSVKMIIKKHGSSGVSDPLDQFASVGYKIHGFAAKYLDASSSRVIKIRSSSALGVN